MENIKRQTLLTYANMIFRNKEYIKAIELYQQVSVAIPGLKKCLDFNIELAIKKYLVSSNELNLNDVIRILRGSALFDENWYNLTYKDVSSKKVNPISHYLKYGMKEWRNPSAEFDTKWYFETYLSSIEENINELKNNSLIHYIMIGATLGHKTKPTLVDKDVVKKHLIAYHSHNLKWQGAQNSLYEISKGIKSRPQFDSCLVASSDGPLISQYDAQSIHFGAHPFPSRGLEDYKEMEKRLNKLAEYYKSINVSLVHANTLQTYFAVLAAKRAGIPVVWNIRESEDPITYFDYLPKCIRNDAFNAINAADAVVFVAKATMDLWTPYSKTNNFYLITNGVDVDRLRNVVYIDPKSYLRVKHGFKFDEIIILCVGTICQRKNQLELLMAYRTLLKRGFVNLTVVLIGSNSSDYSSKVQEEAGRLNISGGKVIIMDETVGESGLVTVAEFYKSADIFVIPSLVESYPRVVMEAMAFNLPVIASKCYGTVEQITDGVNGFLYDSGDVESLVGYLEQLSNDQTKLDIMSRNASISLTRDLSSYGAMIEKYENLYLKLLKIY